MNQKHPQELQAEYMEWLLSAPSDRTIRSKSEWSRVRDVPRRTLYDWERKPAFRKEWEERAKDLQGSPERTQAILDVLHAKAVSEGNVAAAKLWLTTLEKITPPTVKVSSTVRHETVQELSDAELEALLSSSAADELSRRQAVTDERR